MDKISYKTNSEGFRYADPCYSDNLKSQCKALLWTVVTNHPKNTYEDSVLADFLENHTKLILQEKSEFLVANKVIYPRGTRPGTVNVFFLRVSNDCESLLYFYGILPYLHPSVSFVPGSLKSVIPVSIESLEKEDIIFHMLAETKPTIYAGPTSECYINFTEIETSIFGSCRFHRKEVLERLRMRIHNYSRLYDGKEAVRLRSACPINNSRDATLETIQLFLLSVVFSECIEYFSHAEIWLMEDRIRNQLRSSRKRKFLVENMGLMSEYAEELEKTKYPYSPEDFFATWFLSRYNDYIAEMCKYGRMVKENINIIPESIRELIVRLGTMIIEDCDNK